MIWACFTICLLWDDAHITTWAHRVWFRTVGFDKMIFWFSLFCLRVIWLGWVGWQVSGHWTLVEGIGVGLVLSQSQWFSISMAITREWSQWLYVAIAVSQTRLRYNVDDGWQWLQNQLHTSWPGICQLLVRHRAWNCQVLVKYLSGSGHEIDKYLPCTFLVLARYLTNLGQARWMLCNCQADWSARKAEQELAKSKPSCVLCTFSELFPVIYFANN